MAKSKSASKDAAKISKSSKPVEALKSKSKGLAKDVAIKADKKSKKAKKEPTPLSSSETSESEDEKMLSSAGSGSSDDDSEVGTSKSLKKASALNGNGNVKAAKLAADSDSESSASSASSDDEDEPSVPVNGAKVAVDDDSSEGSSDESDEEEAVPGAVDHKELEGKLEKIASKEASSDSDSEGSDASDESSEDEAVKTAPAPKKRKAETEAEPYAKKTKTEAFAGDSDVAQNNLFVGNLSWNIDEEALRQEFGKFGELNSVRIITDKENGRSRGFGYVEFVENSAGLKAKEELTGTMLDNRPLNIDFANAKKDPKERSNQRQKNFGDQSTAPSDTLFVANIAFGANEDTLGEAFGAHGSVTSVRLPTDMESGQPKGYGYVQFGSVEDATAAMEQMSGAVIEGRPIRLDYAGPKPDRNAGGGRGGDRGGRGGRGRGGFDRGGRGGSRGRGGFDRGGRGGGRGGTTNRGGFGDFKGKKMTF